MSTMLEQAIVDAQNLKEAAIKSAESAIVDKYAAEVKMAVATILEQEEEPSLDTEDEVENTALEGVPMAHIPGDEDEIVVVDLDDIIAAADEDDDEEDRFTSDQ